MFRPRLLYLLRSPKFSHPVTGALRGTAIGMSGNQTVVGLLAGVVGSVAGTFGGAKARGFLAKLFGRDLPAALLEDLVAIGITAFALFILAFASIRLSMAYLWVAIGSALGGVARYGLTRFTLNISSTFPLGHDCSQCRRLLHYGPGWNTRYFSWTACTP
jgi:hypothetical protein